MLSASRHISFVDTTLPIQSPSLSTTLFVFWTFGQMRLLQYHANFLNLQKEFWYWGNTGTKGLDEMPIDFFSILQCSSFLKPRVHYAKFVVHPLIWENFTLQRFLFCLAPLSHTGILFYFILFFKLGVSENEQREVVFPWEEKKSPSKCLAVFPNSSQLAWRRPAQDHGVPVLTTVWKPPQEEGSSFHTLLSLSRSHKWPNRWVNVTSWKMK